SLETRELSDIMQSWGETGHMDRADELVDLLKRQPWFTGSITKAWSISADLAYIEMGRLKEAAELLQEQPRRRYAWRRLAVKRAAVPGEFDEAIRMLDQRHAPNHNTLAEIAANLLVSGDWHRARAIFLRLIQETYTSYTLGGWNQALSWVAVVLA